MRKGPPLPAWLPRAVIVFVLLIGMYMLGRADNQNGDGSSIQSWGGGPARAQEIIRRFKYAERYVQRMQVIGKHEMYTLTQCPKNFSIGSRTTPGQIIPQYVGNTCEPWIARFAVIFLDRLLDADMDGLEWSTGSSTQWVLMRIRSLISIEHHAEWSELMESSMARLFHPDDLASRWKLYAVNAMPGTLEKGPDKEDITKFRDYAAATFLTVGATYDYISVDGRVRMDCLARALPLLKAEGGILLLDNSERKSYQKAFQMVPSHWLKFEDLVNTGEKTTIWVSCLPGKCGEEHMTAPAAMARAVQRR